MELMRLAGTLAVLLSCCPLVCAEVDKTPEREWPDVLLIDDFESGLDNWENQDAGRLEAVEDAAEGKKALRWTAGDDGIGHIVFKNLTKEKVDFSQYDILMFQVKFEGKRIWNLNPVIQQFPAVYGYRGLYYSVDTLEKFGEWFTYTQDLRRWENAWPDTFSKDKQEFEFQVSQLAGAERTKVYLDDIRLVRNALGIEKSCPGLWAEAADGGQVTHFRVKLQNRGKSPITVRAALVADSLDKFRAELPPEPTRMLPAEAGEVFVRVTVPATVVEVAPAWYGETARIAFTVAETPGLVLFAELPAGTKPKSAAHPTILLDPARQSAMRKKWKDPEQRKSLERGLLSFVRKGEAALGYEPTYPSLACTGLTKCSDDGTALKEIEVPNLPFRTYQCPECGKPFSGPMYDAGMQKWAGKHLGNASTARNLGFAYGITGRKEFAVAAAKIVKAYVGRYQSLPISAPSAGSPVFSHTSGASRIGSSYMFEQRWLANLAVTVDFIRQAGVLSAQDLRDLSEEVFAPSAHLIMDHKVGAMNLQWMIQSAALYAGLAVENPGIVARAMYDNHGILNLIHVGYLPDGNWWENPSYQNVANGIAFPVMATCINTGLLKWDDKLNQVFKAAYKLYGPDGRGPTLGTGGPGGYHYSDNAIHSLAGFITDPELAWVAHHRKRWRATSGGGEPYQSYLWALTWQSAPKVPKEKTVCPIPDGTTILPEYGGIALRVPGEKNYCYLHFGRELVHGHRNKLSINAYANGGWFVRNVMGGYQDNFKDFLETIASSSSIMTDGEDPDADTGELLFHRSGSGWEAASAREVGAYKNVEHERSLVLTGDVLVVIDRCLAEAEHTYDWLYQSCWTKLALDKALLQESPLERLGESRLYSSLHPLGKFASPDKAHLTRKDGSGLRLGFVPGGDLYAFHARKKYDGLLRRKKGRTTSFACVMFPYAKDEVGEPQIEQLKVLDAQGKEADLSQGQAYRASAAGKELTVLVNYTSQELQSGPLKSKERVSVSIAGGQ